MIRKLLKLSVSGKLVLLLAVIAAVVSVWQAVLGDWSRAGVQQCVTLYWLVLVAKNLADLRGR